jgi:hypothetical protein
MVRFFRNLSLSSLLLVLAVIAGCTGGDSAPEPDAPGVSADANPQDAFFETLASLCGKAFAGEAVLASSDAFDAGLIMHVRKCTETELQIPVHTGENRSRTWIITRTAEGLRLKHDHRLEDGTDDPVTQYGGDTADQGTALQQSFPADAFTAELLPEAATNVWTITLEPGERLIYHLTRHDAPRATFVLDLTREVPAPPAPWGYEGS